MARNRAHTWFVRLINQMIQRPRIVLYRVLSKNMSIGVPRKIQPVLLMGLGNIYFDNDVVIGVYTSPDYYTTYTYIEARKKTSSINIKSGTRFNNNVSIISGYTNITIGHRCLIGAGVQITDSDFHGLPVAERHLSKPEWAKPVIIGDDVFIGSNARIMKGVSIGDGSVIANGSVVVKDVPPGVIAGGNPARVIRAVE